MKNKTLFWIFLALDVYLLFSQSSTPGTADVDDPDAANDGDVLGDAYASTIGAVVAIVSSQTVSANGLQFTAGFEGCRLTAYYDVNSYSIGYGHKPASQGQTCQQSDADGWLQSDLEAAANYVLSKSNVALGQNMLDALADWVYNLGTGKVRSATLWTLLNSGDYAGAAAQLPRWCNVSGSPNAALLARRNAEMNLFLTPDGD